VTHAEVHYRSPARYGHVLMIETRMTHRSKATLTFSHTIRERASRQIVVEGSATLASVNLEGKLKRLPQPLRDMPEQPLPPPIAPPDSRLQTAPRSLARRRGKQSG
jgi:acyl-CoA thioesterase FadM